jgi:cell division protein FtsI (penicillin-binding protein 3)
MIRDRRISIVHWALALFAAALIGRAALVQLVQGKSWAAMADRQHFLAADRPAPRGTILDASGTPLAQSRELVSVTVVPPDVRDRGRVARVLARAGVPPLYTRRITNPKKYKWVEIPGRFLPSEIASIASLRGVRTEPVAERVYVESDGLRRMIGRMGPTGVPVDGIELALDSMLRGQRGVARVARDAKGRRFESPDVEGEEPTPGHTVVLTINRTLQDITDRALGNAVASMGAAGGDIVVVDPGTGEVLAMASKRSDVRSTAATALTEPFQPGSTLKPFIASALLMLKRARPDEVIETYGGRYTTYGRTITDVHVADRLSLSDVLKFSSNVGIARFAERLAPREQYEWLRDFGFGSPTGMPYPSEAAGILREPKYWSKQSPASIAIGYEIAVTPLQLAMAYAALANGGELLEPALVKEIRSDDGTVVYRHERSAVRRVVTSEVAATIRRMLIGVVDSGTAMDADLQTFVVAGKSGTARGMKDGRYIKGSYTATFVGLFPAENPQYVVLVKLDDPVGAYYGGKTAAPVSKVVLQAAIAARDAALDRNGLIARRVPPARAETLPIRPVVAAAPESLGVTTGAGTPGDETALAASDVPFVVNLADKIRERPAAARMVPVPDVQGLTLRSAVHRLHESGFRVELVPGAKGTTSPAAGSQARTGSVVRLAP